MNTLFRPLLRTSAFRVPPLALRRSQPIARPTVLNRAILNTTALHARTVASNVSMKPGSQTLEHAATNVKEELGNSATDLAKVIAGANVTSTQDAGGVVTPSGVASFFGITKSVAKGVPEPMMVLGLTGGLPYVGASATTVYLAYQAQLATNGLYSSIDPGVALTILDRALTLQVTYGAVMLSFLGALHWGMEIAGYGGQKGYARLGLGTAPMVVAWSTLAMEPMTALITQWMGYTALWYADSKATQAGWTPKWYSQYRFYLSILVGTCIIGSLAGTSYWGPVAGHGLLSHDLEYLREERRKHMPEKHGEVPGQIEAIPAGEKASNYIRIHNKETDSGKGEEGPGK
ncbi:hypothetical protein BDQ12DRAFT_633986 [Crucibulum laeve]|uniref:Uncharacterized protein n=1 Tax=Crucibulum laeve TaxID=68775 RepID=A0A5C3LW84_9AGAR|nr:hypothetical protein BDQ12DRAFT_633986 [Crucibulum laeve]